MAQIGRHDGGTMSVAHSREKLPEPKTEPLRRHARILVVDDDCDLRETVCMVLQAAGYTAVQAGDGTAGLSRFRSEEFDLVLSDFHMPNMNGLQMMAEMRKLCPDVPVVIASGGASADEREMFRQAGAFSVLAKPFELRELEAVVDRALNFH